jgi:hypothetical protein
VFGKKKHFVFTPLCGCFDLRAPTTKNLPLRESFFLVFPLVAFDLFFGDVKRENTVHSFIAFWLENLKCILIHESNNSQRAMKN